MPKINTKRPRDDDALGDVTTLTPARRGPGTPVPPQQNALQSNSDRDRLRVFRACDRCKLKKTKCDGFKPCRPCSKIDVKCCYTPTAFSAMGMTAMTMFRTPIPTDQLPSNLSKTTFSQPELVDSLDFGAEATPALTSALLERNRQLERTIQQLQARGLISASDLEYSGLWNFSSNTQTAEEVAVGGLVQPPMNGDDKNQPGLVSAAHSVRNGKDSKDRKEFSERLASVVTAHAGNSVEVDFLAYSKFKYTRRYIHVLGNVFGRSLYENLPNNSQRLVTLPRVQAYGWNMSGGHYLPQRKMPMHPKEIAKETADYLLAFFFEKVNPLYATLHQPMFMKQYESYCFSKYDELRSQDLYLFSGILHCVFAIAMRFSETEDSSKSYEPGLEEEYFNYSHDILKYFVFQWESIEIIQGWLLICMYLRACHRQSSTWMALGEAVRLCNGMGIMKSCWLASHIPKYNSLKLIRTFWNVFLWDRLIGIDTGRPFAISEHEVSLPLLNEYVDDGWLTKPAYCLIRLVICLNPLVKDVGYGLAPEHLDIINSALKNWNSVEAARFGAESDSNYDKAFDGEFDPSMIAQLRCQYHECVLYVNSRTLFAMIDPQWENAISVHKQLIADSSRGIILVLDKLDEVGRLETSWWLKLSSLYSGTLSLLVLLNSAGNDHRNLGRYLTRGIGLVDKFAKNPKFAMAKEAKWALRTLNHLVYLRFRDCQNILKQAGIEHGDEDVNKRRFASMGPLDKTGKVASLGNDKNSAFPMWRNLVDGTTNVEFEIGHSENVSKNWGSAPGKGSSEGDSSEAWEFQPPPFEVSPSGMVNLGPGDIQAGGKSTLEEAQQRETKPNPAGSLDWFNGFAWDENSSVASFLNMDG